MNQPEKDMTSNEQLYVELCSYFPRIKHADMESVFMYRDHVSNTTVRAERPHLKGWQRFLRNLSDVFGIHQSTAQRIHFVNFTDNFDFCISFDKVHQSAKVIYKGVCEFPNEKNTEDPAYFDGLLGPNYPYYVRSLADTSNTDFLDKVFRCPKPFALR